MSNSFTEIGSEFWLDSIPETLLEERDGLYCLSGRTAIDLILQTILKKRSLRSVYMPSWCCDSMLAPFLDRGIRIEFYDIAFNGHLNYLIEENACPDVFFLTNYFGYENTLPIELVRTFKERGSVIIYDRTHSFLLDDSEYRLLADYSFASIRKWMGVVDGAVVEGLEHIPLKSCSFTYIREQAMQDKARYLQGDAAIVKQNFLDAYGDFNHRLSADYRDYAMDDLSYTLYRREAIQKMKKRRQENAAFIHDHLQGVSFICDNTTYAAQLFVPVLFESKEQRDFVRKSLISKQIYCPIHWPKPQLIPTGFEVNSIFDRELSLLCDQRYGLYEMKRQIDSIHSLI